jgi:hypothetical protein
MSKNNGDLVIRYCWSRKHKVERTYGAWAAIASLEYGVYLTSASVRALNCPTKSWYALFVWSWAYEAGGRYPYPATQASRTPQAQHEQPEPGPGPEPESGP